jgi:hypothetical protein
MGKKKCEKKEYKEPENPNFTCKKCNRSAQKKSKVCKPQKNN